jgi:HTH-type transcriptional regulator/antitoxin MqsA
MSKPITCPMCGGSSISIHVDDRRVHAEDGTPLPYKAHFSKCATCGEEFYTREQAREASRSAARVARTFEELLTPSEIVAIRGQYRVSQDLAQRIMRFGKKSFVRWEGGTVRQSRAADQLLRQVRDSPALFYRMAANAGIELPVVHSTEQVWSDLLATLATQVKTHAVAALRQAAEPFSYATTTVPGKVGWAVRETPQFEYVAKGASEDQPVGSASPSLL